MILEINFLMYWVLLDKGVSHQRIHFYLEYASSETNKTHGYKIQFFQVYILHHMICFTNKKVPLYNKMPYFIVSKNCLGKEFT